METLRDTLTHMLVHDIRSPLTGELASFHFLRNDLAGKIPDESQADLQRGTECIQDIVRMINDVLDVSRIDAGAMPVEASATTSADLVQRALDSLSGHTRDRNIDLSGIDATAELVCDVELIRRVIVNLLALCARASRCPTTVSASQRKLRP